MIVQEPSVRHVGYDHVIHVAADHFNVCKPEGVRDNSFLHLIGCIEEVVTEFQFSQAQLLELPSLVVGVGDKLERLHYKLKMNPIVGLVGMGGVGKTTLSKVMYNLEREHYERCSYLEDVKSHSNIVGFQKQLLRELCDEKWDDNEDPRKYLWKIQQCIKTKKVLVVIDDVGTEENLKALHVLAFQKEGSSGSKLVVTCRDWATLLGYMCEGEIMEVDVLDSEQSMELFSHYAFEGFEVNHEIGSQERKKFEDEAVHIVNACGGLPLSIEVIGQYLHKQNRFRGEDRLDLWHGALKRLKAAEAIGGHRGANERLWSKLKISYDELGELEKCLFLDFACILCDMKKRNMRTIARIWDDRHGLQTLIDSSLIKVANKQLTQYFSYEKRVPIEYEYVKELVMHDQLQDMGRWLMRDFKRMNVQKRMLHIWERSEVEKFFEANEDSWLLEGLSLVDEQKLSHHGSNLFESFASKILQSQHTHPNLRLLNLSCNDVNVVKYVLQICLANPQSLRWLCLNSMGTTRSDLEILNAKFMELRVLQMSECRILVELPASIGELFSLKELDLRGCSYLETIPNAIGKLENLQVVILSDCIDLKELPESVGDLVQLLELDLSGCGALKSVPSTLGKLERLKLLNLHKCGSLEAIPAGVGQLTKLEILDLDDCGSLHTMCEFHTQMHHLHTLNLQGCSRLESFESLGNLYRLRTLNLNYCSRLCIASLAESVGQLRNLQVLKLRFCKSMAEEVAETVGKGHLLTDHLQVFSLSAFPETTLPFCPQLRVLFLSNDPYCEQPKELPKAFSESLGDLVGLQVLHLQWIPCVPESVSKLTQLHELYVTAAKGMMTNPLPDALSKLVRLEVFHIRDLSCERLPDLVGDLLSLREFSLRNCSELVELPSSLGRLSQLRELTLSECWKLERLPEAIGGLTQLRALNLSSCKKLERLPESLAGLTQLSSLDLSGCRKVVQTEDVLHALRKRGCHVEV